ncbi:hypothetical protein QBC40DRAFT_235130 [Triangularia verruculosa]|uniref:GPI inositol-deacylase n=1 Tax=Triangularia verruculosa TaxID=2587418 RepID=A0AAN6XE15_9PEZI|nr:hypothetical protein QBC40DRAFT_235130 [Triangularia verruculosa]
MFWPKEWLPSEAGFEHVRIHSFGYNSDWTTRKASHLTVHDFGQALVADISNSPHLSKNRNTPIIFVSHSMGGLVVKKAYLLASHDPTYKSIHQRIHTMYFLGTSHRGADSAQFTKLLRYTAGNGAKAFINDLVPGNKSIDQLNDEFRHVCNKVHIWSFFETIPMSFGLIVKKESAVIPIGLPGEQVRYMEADHRHLCKFDGRENPNYIVLRNAFISTIKKLEDQGSQAAELQRSQMSQISSFLRIDQRPESIFLALNEKQHDGSCRWLTDEDSFQTWFQSLVGHDVETVSAMPTSSGFDSPQVLWLCGRPGTGKSVASTHITRHLESAGFDCRIYFFRHDDQPGATTSALLRSLAFQMAESSSQVRQAIMDMIENGTAINHDDQYTLASRLFTNGIFKIQSLKPQFWVIDALDECNQESLSAFVSMISKIDNSIPLRLFLTSRPGGQLQRLFAHEKTRLCTLSTGMPGSLHDIEAFVRARCSRLGDDVTRERLVTELLKKSNGSFLWTSLTLSRLDGLYCVEDMEDALSSMPVRMNPLYIRIATSIEESASYELTKCLLGWVICAQRPLLMTELCGAIKLDIGRTLTASPAQLEHLTGHLVFVDRDSRVQVTHETTSDFLTRPRDGLWIDRQTTHSRISEICLTTLCGSEFAPPKAFQAASNRTNNMSPFAAYAAASFSFHFAYSAPPSDAELSLMDRFIRSNVLTWIEKAAQNGDLSVLQQASSRLRGYLAKRSNQKLHGSMEIKTLAAWLTDLDRMIAVFNSCLLESPLSIHFLVPYLCPPTSVMNKTFARPSRGLNIKGFVEQRWGDRLTCRLLSEEPLAIACCDRLLAVGLLSGKIELYLNTKVVTFQSIGSVMHDAAGKGRIRLEFNADSSILASCCTRKLALWDVRSVDGSSFPCIWTQSCDLGISRVPTFTPDGRFVVLGEFSENSLLRFSTLDGAQEKVLLSEEHGPKSSAIGSNRKGATKQSERPNWSFQINSTHTLAALGHLDAKVELWDLESVARVGYFEAREMADCIVVDTLFNPSPHLDLLAIRYMHDGGVVACHPRTLEQVGAYSGKEIYTMSATLDGRILAVGLGDGSIDILSFKTLQQLYHIPPFEGDDLTPPRGLTFSTDNFRLYDTRRLCCNVWTPSVLLETAAAADSSKQIDQRPLVSRDHQLQGARNVTFIDTSKGASIIIGRENGEVESYDIETGSTINKFQLHDPTTEISDLESDEEQNPSPRIAYGDWDDAHDIILGVDLDNCQGTIVGFRNGFGGSSMWRCRLPRRCVINNRGDRARQAIISPHGTQIIIVFQHTAKLITINHSNKPASEVNELDLEAYWATDPSNSSRVLAIGRGTVDLFYWNTLERVCGTINLEAPDYIGSLLWDRIYTHWSGSSPWIANRKSHYIVRCTRNGSGNKRTANGFIVLDASKFVLGDGKTTGLVHRAFRNLEVVKMVGMIQETLFFLDTKHWVCSISANNMEETKHYARHFFIPPTWHTGDNIPVIGILSTNLMAVAVGSQLVWIRGFMDYQDKVSLVHA